MKRTLFIIIGGVALFLIFALWLYLLLFGTPRSVSEVVGDFGFGDVTVTPITPSATGNDDTARHINLSTSGTLYQLTTKPVAGFRVIGSENEARVIYAERGPGHVYNIDIATGEETRVSAKTFVAIHQASFSPDGGAVALVGEIPEGASVHLQELGDERTDHNLPPGAGNIAFLSERRINYSLTGQNGTTGYSYDLDSGATTQLFGIPLSDPRVIWSATGPLVYPRTAPKLAGRLYEAAGNSLTPISVVGTAFSAMASEDFVGLRVETMAYNNIGNLVSSASMTGSDGISLGISVLPEKCAFDPSSMMTIWCASPTGLITPKTQADWYKGLMNMSDVLWRIDLSNNGTATIVDDLAKTSGRQLDVTDIIVDDTGEYLLFKNKNDDTLWLKRLTLPSTSQEPLNTTPNEELLGNSEEVTDSEI